MIELIWIRCGASPRSTKCPPESSANLNKEQELCQRLYFAQEKTCIFWDIFHGHVHIEPVACYFDFFLQLFP